MNAVTFASMLIVMGIQFSVLNAGQLKLAVAIQRLAAESNCQAPASTPARPLVTQAP
jgi:hypothetical protein